MSTKKKISIKHNINLTRKVLPSFHSFIWSTVILKYLSPKDILVLSRVCWSLRILIRDNLNHFWYYQLLIANGTIPLYGYKHNKSFFVNCLDLATLQKYKYPTHYRSNSVNDINEYNSIHMSLLPKKIIHDENLSTIIIGRNFVLPPSLCNTNCRNRHHWTPIFPTFDQFNDFSLYDKDTNYFFSYIDSFYEKNKYTLFYRIDNLINQKNMKIQQIDYIKKQFVTIPAIEQSIIDIDKEINAFDHIKERRKLDIPQNLNAQGLFMQESLAENPPKHYREINKIWRNKTPKEKLAYRSKVQTLKDNAEANIQAFLSSRI